MPVAKSCSFSTSPARLPRRLSLPPPRAGTAGTCTNRPDCAGPLPALLDGEVDVAVVAEDLVAGADAAGGAAHDAALPRP